MNQPSASADIRRELVSLLPRLRRFALTLGGSAAEADGLVGEACARAVQKSHHWKGEGRIEEWLFSMIRTTADDLKKRRTTAAVAATDESRAGLSGGPLAALPDGLASALLLADVEGFSYRDAAAILGLAQETFAARLCSARLYLAAREDEMAERRA